MGAEGARSHLLLFQACVMYESKVGSIEKCDIEMMVYRIPSLTWLQQIVDPTGSVKKNGEPGFGSCRIHNGKMVEDT